MIIIRNIPIYWGVETEPADRSFLTGAWLFEDMPPYRQAVRAIRIRVSHKHWFHLGVFKYNRDALHTGLAYRPSDIGRWGRDQTEDDDTDTPPGEGVEPLEPAVDGGSGDGAGDEPAEDGGTVPGLAAQGVGPEVAALPDGDGDRPGVPDRASSAAQG